MSGLREGFTLPTAEVDRPTCRCADPHDLAVFIPGVPVGKGRVELRNIQAVRRGARPVMKASNEDEQGLWVREIAAALRAADVVPAEPWPGPVWLWAGVVLPRVQRLRKDETLHIVQPDADKLLRCVFDALKTVGVYRDDAQVNEPAGAPKRYARPGETPGLHLRLIYLSDPSR